MPEIYKLNFCIIICTYYLLPITYYLLTTNLKSSKTQLYYINDSAKWAALLQKR